MAEEQNSAVQPVAGSIEEAAERIRQRREKVEPTGKTGTGEEADDTTRNASSEDEGAAAEDESQESTGNAGTEDSEEGDGSDNASGSDDAGEGDDTVAAAGGDSDESDLALNSFKPEELNRKIKLKVDGEVIETTLREALRGHMRERDYTRKTEALRQLGEKHVQSRDQYDEGLSIVEALLTKERVPGFRTKEQWEALYAENPDEFAAERQRYLMAQESQTEAINALKAERARVAAERQGQMQAETTAYLVGQMQRLCTALKIDPKDPKAPEKRAEWMGKNINYLKRQGLSDRAIGSIQDADAFLIIDKARQFDEMKTNKQNAQGKQVVQARPVLQPQGGKPAARPSTAQVAEKNALQELKKTGSLDAATAALAARRRAREAAERRGR